MDWNQARWPNFSEAEFRCKGTGENRMDHAFMDRLQSLRKAWGRPMAVTSGFRAPEYNAKVSSTGLTGPHTTGRAVDILIRGIDALNLAIMAREFGFTGIGFQQKGAVRFVHLDDLPNNDGQPRPHIWTY